MFACVWPGGRGRQLRSSLCAVTRVHDVTHSAANTTCYVVRRLAVYTAFTLLRTYTTGTSEGEGHVRLNEDIHTYEGAKEDIGDPLTLQAAAVIPNTNDAMIEIYSYYI